MSEQKQPENPSAFPHPLANERHPGMTLRDYFAAKAMQADITSDNWNGLEDSDPELIAAMAYEMADAMLRAREARP